MSLAPLTISYGGGPTVLSAWVQNFVPVDDYSRSSRNVATSGLVETILESPDVMVSWTIPALSIASDYAAWATFFRWAADGSQFDFKANSASSKTYHAVLESKRFQPRRGGLGRYSLDVQIRIIPDGSAPADAGEVMQAFWGIV